MANKNSEKLMNKVIDFPLITVITVCLNAAEFIEQTIQSVLSQSYSNLEYIIIDGGSKDETVQIIRKYESLLTYWHSKTDRGVAHAFNIGLAVSQGDWILFLNADDFFLDFSVVEKMSHYLINLEEADVVFGETIIMTRQKNPHPSPLRKIHGDSWRFQNFRWVDTIPHQSAFTNRKYFQRVGGFDENYRLVMDYEIYLRGGHELKAIFVPILLCGMRERGISNKTAIQTYLECRKAQYNNKAIPYWISWLNYCWQVARHFWGRFFHKILDPFAYKIKWEKRNSGDFLKNWL